MTQDSESVVVPRDQQRQLDAEQLMDAAGTLSRCGYGEDAEEVRAIALRLAAAPSTSVREEGDQVRIAAWNAAKKAGATDEVGYAVAKAVAAEFAALVSSPDEGKRHG